MRVVVVVGLGALLLAACLTPSEQTCDGVLCPAAQACVPGLGCVDDALLTACADAAQFAPCQAGGITDGVCYAEAEGTPRRCIAAGCGNGVQEPSEACDDGNRVDDETCSADCGSEVACGNGVRDWNEGCDCGDDPDDLPAGCPTVNGDAADAICRTDCSAAGCGDGQVVAPEDCEAGQALTATCADLGYYGGALACLPTCRFDVSGCSGRCGDGVLEGSEGCEAVPLDVGLHTCEEFGYYGGALGCNAVCGFDLSGCVGTCGDGVREGPEDCENAPEGVDLGDATCGDLGFYGGELRCNASCRYDVGACAGRCGDGVVDAVEQCDGSAPAFGCGEVGGTFGRPGCTGGCSADLRGCPSTTLTTTASALPGALPIFYVWTAPDDGSHWAIDQNSANVQVLDGPNRQTHALGPTASLILDLAVVASDDVWAIDCDGTVLHWDGASWAVDRVGAAACTVIGNIHVDATGVYATDEAGTQQRQPDGSWAATPTSAPNVVEMARCGATLFALSYGGTSVYRYDAPTWTPLNVGFTPWRGACSTDETQLWVVGEVNRSARINVATGAVSTQPYPGAFDFLYSVMVADDVVLAPGGVNNDYLWHGRRWGVLDARTYGPHGTYVSVDRATADGFTMVENVGRVRQTDRLVGDYGTPSSWALGPTTLWEVVGTTLRVGGVTVATVPAGTMLTAAGDVTAASADAAVFAWSGTSIRRCTQAACAAPTTLPPGATVISLTAASADEAYASTAGGWFRWDGAAWSAWIGPGAAYRQWLAGPGHLFALSSFTLYEYTTALGWQAVLVAPGQLSGVGGRWPDQVVALGYGGASYRRDPASGAWHEDPHSLTTEALTATTMRGDVLMAWGGGDVVLEHDGAGWMLVNLRGVETDITGMQGTPAGDLWVRGSHGLYEIIAPR